MARVRLTVDERRICQWVGEQRYNHALNARRNPGAGPSSERGGPHHDIRGALCEFAGSLILNLYWRPTVGQIDQPDIGGIVEVRSTDRPNGRLIIKPGEIGPFLLVIQYSDHEYESPGWIDAVIGMSRFERTAAHGDPCHFVPQWALEPVRSLVELTHRRVSEG